MWLIKYRHSMYSEKQVREILHEKRQQLQFHFRIRDLYKEEYNQEFVEYLNREIILIETILEESSWQKLMGQNKKKKWWNL